MRTAGCSKRSAPAPSPSQAHPTHQTRMPRSRTRSQHLQEFFTQQKESLPTSVSAVCRHNCRSQELRCWMVKHPGSKSFRNMQSGNMRELKGCEEASSSKGDGGGGRSGETFFFCPRTFPVFTAHYIRPQFIFSVFQTVQQEWDQQNHSQKGVLGHMCPIYSAVSRSP